MSVRCHRGSRHGALACFALGAAFTAACLGPGTLNEEEPCAEDAPALVAQRCLTCHSVAVEGGARGGAPEGINYDDEAGLLENADGIREQLEAGSMPPTRPMADCNVALLEAYLDTLE